MLDGADVPEGGPLATWEQLNSVATLFKLNRTRWYALADRVGLTEAQAATIIAATRLGWRLNNELVESARVPVPTF